MHQPALNGEKSWLIALLAVLALSSLGFAVLGLVLTPELALELELERQHSLQVIAVPEVPDFNGLMEFWQESGFHLVHREKHYNLQQDQTLERAQVWLEGQETWVLVPENFQTRLAPVLFEICEFFLDQGWLIQIEAQASSYTLGFWSTAPELDHKVLAYYWHLELLNPTNYNQYKMGFVPVMGKLFDPQDFKRGTPEAPVLAMIIDDWGYETPAAEPLLAYPFPLTIAVLPHLFISKEVSERAHKAGHEVILHQPMEALNQDLDLGPGGITVKMSPEEKVAQLEDNLASLPLVVGLNNHMGSRATEDPSTVTEILQVVKEQGLFFVDSHTSSRSVVPEMARVLQVPFGVNNLFIDNENDLEKIKEQVRLGLSMAKKQGHAIIIGHVRSTTALALWEMIPEFLTSGVELVPVSSLVKRP